MFQANISFVFLILPTNVSISWFLWDFCAIYMNIWYKSIILVLRNICGVCIDISFMCAIMFSMEFRYYSYEATKQLQPICQYRTMTLISYVKEVTIFNFPKILSNTRYVIKLYSISRMKEWEINIWLAKNNGKYHVWLWSSLVKISQTKW